MDITELFSRFRDYVTKQAGYNVACWQLLLSALLLTYCVADMLRNLDLVTRENVGAIVLGIIALLIILYNFAWKVGAGSMLCHVRCVLDLLSVISLFNLCKPIFDGEPITGIIASIELYILFTGTLAYRRTLGRWINTRFAIVLDSYTFRRLEYDYNEHLAKYNIPHLLMVASIGVRSGMTPALLKLATIIGRYGVANMIHIIVNFKAFMEHEKKKYDDLSFFGKVRFYFAGSLRVVRVALNVADWMQQPATEIGAVIDTTIDAASYSIKAIKFAKWLRGTNPTGYFLQYKVTAVLKIVIYILLSLKYIYDHSMEIKETPMIMIWYIVTITIVSMYVFIKTIDVFMEKKEEMVYNTNEEVAEAILLHENVGRFFRKHGKKLDKAKTVASGAHTAGRMVAAAVVLEQHTGAVTATARLVVRYAPTIGRALFAMGTAFVAAVPQFRLKR